MKYFPPFALAILLTACAAPTPEDQQAARVRQLEKEARENFIALKAQEHPGRPVVLHDEGPAATPAPHMMPFLGSQQPATAPVSAPRAKATGAAAAMPPSKARMAASAKPRQKAKGKNNDTVYYWQTQGSAKPASAREQRAEAIYARALAKRPQDLTPEERVWAHEHY